MSLPIDDHTLAFWPFDELLNNIRDRNVFAALACQSFNGPTFNTTQGVINQDILIGNVAALRFERTQAFSISFWAALGGFSGTYTIYSNAAVTTGRGIAVITDGTNTLSFRLRNTTSTNELLVRLTTPVGSTGEEAHYVITYDGTSLAAGVQFYANGVVQAKTTVTNNLSATIVSTGNLYIGKDGDLAVVNRYPGTLRQMAVWNVALSSPQQALVFGQGAVAPLYLSLAFAANLVGWWQIFRSDTYGNVAGGVLDRSGAGNHGTSEGSMALYNPALFAPLPSGNGVCSICGGPRQFLDPAHVAADYARWFNATYGVANYNEGNLASGGSWPLSACQGPAWTVEAWVYVDRSGVAVGAAQGIVEFDSTFAGGTMCFSLAVSATNQLRMQWESLGGTLRTLAAGTVPIQTWVHVAVRAVLNGANRDAEFFIGGASQGVVTGVPKSQGTETSNSWRIGRQVSVTNPFFGAISYVRFSRVGRSNSEIVAAAADAGSMASDNDTVAFWDFQALVTQVRDAGKYGRHAMEQGMLLGANGLATFDQWGITGPNFVFPGHQYLNTGTSDTQFDASYSQFFADALAVQNEATIEMFVRPDNANSHTLFYVGGTAAQQAIANNIVVQWSLLSNQLFQVLLDAEAGISWFARTLLPAFVTANQGGELGRWYYFALRKRAAGSVPGFWKFDGVDDAITMGNVAAYNFERTTPFSAIGWVNSATLAIAHLVGKTESDATPAGWQLSFDASGRLQFRIENAANQLVLVRSTSVVQLNGLYNMVGVSYSGSSTAAGVILYANGAALSMTTVTNTLAAGTSQTVAPFTIGRRNLADQPFNGYIQHVSVWNRVLTAGEMLEAFGLSGRPPPNLLASSMNAALIGWWKLDALATALVVVDYSATAANGAAAGGLDKISKLCVLYDFFVNGVFLETVGPLPQPEIGDVYAATASQYFISMHLTNDQFSQSRVRLSDIARTEFELFQQFLEGSTGQVLAEFEVIPISPTPGTLVGETEALVFDVRCTDEITRIFVAPEFVGFPFTELAYAQQPDTSEPFEALYVGSSVVRVVDPGFFRYRFTLRRAPVWPDSPEVTVYAFAQGVEL